MTNTLTFENPNELARELFDRAVKPSDTGAQRVKLAIAAATYAAVVFPGDQQ